MRGVRELYKNSGCLLATLTIILLVVLLAGLVFGAFCLEGWVFMLLWNWLAVEYLGAPILGFWVCVGIVVAINFVGRMLFGFNISIKLE